MFKRLRMTLLLATFVCVSPAFSCNDTACYTPEHTVAAPSMHNQNQLINDIWIAAKNTNPWVASGAVSLAVFIMLYNNNESFRKTVRNICTKVGSICGLNDDCACTDGVVQK